MLISQAEIQIDGFIVKSVLGYGGTSIVYYAEKNGEKFALKIYRRLGPNGILPTLNFLSNYEAALSFNHPNIGKVISMKKWEETFYILLEYIDGINLMEWAQIHLLATNENQFSHYILQAASSLYYLECNGYVHGDIRPQNILISQNQARLIDFDSLQSIHKPNNNRYFFTTSAYLELDLLGQKPRILVLNEIYSFGAMIRGLLRNAKFSRGCYQLAEKCLAKDYKKRPQSFNEIIETIRNF